MTENVPPTLEQLHKQHRDLTEKVLDRATSDPLWKQQFLDDPEGATSEFPEAQWFRETTEAPPPEAMPIPQEEYRQLQRSLWEKMLDQAESDPLWRQQLIDDQEATMAAANFPEIERLEEMRQQSEQVVGQQLGSSYDQVLFNWWGSWQAVSLSPWEIDVLSSGNCKVGGITY